MKHIFFTISLICAVLFASAQVPQKLNYQGIARGSNGQPLNAANLGLRISIHDATPTGTLVYQETHTATTNAYGLYSIAVGNGSVVSGTFNTIDWATSDKFIQVEIDPAGGTSYVDAGTSQLLSVPYAIQSSKTAKATKFQIPYYDSMTTANTLFAIENPGDGLPISAISGSTTANAVALKGTISNTAPGGFSSAVRGINNGTGGLGIGVWGSQAGSGWGVYGQSPSGIGAYGNSTSGYGLYGNSTTGTGLYATSSTGNTAVFSVSNNANTNHVVTVSTAGTGNGVNSSVVGGIGVYGVASSASGVGIKAGNSTTGSVGTALEIENGAIKLSGTNKAAFIHTATVANKLSSNGTDVDNPMCNGDANCILIVTQKLGTGIVYNNSPIGVYYNSIRSKWEIFNENNVAIPTGAQFNVLVIKQ